ncbi:MAG: spondin domain-containing protein [Acidobacteriota bacterium]|nr:spondin domain-containing protein [Acidobacteriota bacterium]
MKTRNIWMGIALLLSVLLLATCGGDSGTTPAPAPAPPPAPAPAPAPAPEPEPETPEMATYSISYAPHYSTNPLFLTLGAQPYPNDGSASNEIAFIAHPLGTVVWEDGGTATEGLEHLAWDGHAHDLADEARDMGWMVLAESFDEIIALLGASEITLSSEFPCISYAQKFNPSPDWFIGFNACAIHDDNGELHWEDTLEVRAEMWDAGVRDGEPYMTATGETDPFEPISRVMTPPWDTESISTITGTLQE